MINYTDFFLGLFTASFASALGAYLNHLTNVSRLKKEREKYNKALLLMFLRCIDNCARFIMTTGVYSAFSEWDYSLWPEIRVEIAKAYPTEFIKFTLLIEKMSVVKAHSDVEFLREEVQHLKAHVQQLQ